MMTLVDCRPDSPFRPVDWRWRLAEAFHAGLMPVRKRGLDPWVGRAIGLLRDHSACEGHAPYPKRVRRKLSTIGAYRIWKAEHSGLRRELEYRILSGQPGGEIAERCRLSSDVVETYERMFYDVRSRLNASDYIAAVVIGTSPIDGLSARDVDAIVKGYAYWGGPHVLDALLGVLDLSAPGGVRMTVNPLGESPLTRSIWMASLARSIPASEQNASRLIRLEAQLVEIKQDAAADVALAAPIRATIDPFPAEQLRSQSVLVTPPVSTCVGRAEIGPDLDWCLPWGPPVIHGPLAGADAFHCPPASRRTA